MQKLKKNRKIIIGVLIGIIMSSTISYVIASTLINSKDVIYEDNSNLMADNVQEAIDGTCSKIDTRLSDIEDKLYIISNLYNVSRTYTSTQTLSYTGASIVIPANSYCSFTVKAVFSNSPPTDLLLCYSPSECGKDNDFIEGNFGETKLHNLIYLTYNEYSEKGTVLYIWASHTVVANNRLEVHGYCATKYK